MLFLPSCNVEEKQTGTSIRKDKEMQVTPMRNSKKRGCEIEARDISYKVCMPCRKKKLRIWSKNGGKEEQRSTISTMEEQDQKNGWWWRRRDLTENQSHVRHILKNVSCRAKPWEILAIVGPSGAGKSTFLEILAGKLPLPESRSPPVIFVNEKPINKDRFSKISGYVTQKDTLFPLLTVRETLLFTAMLRIQLPYHQIASRVDNLMEELGLKDISNTCIGDDKIRGVSGGERRRVSIGVEVIHDPKVLILDEPTSGLDSMSALQIIDMLKKMAEARGRTVILSIHQPGFRIVKMFNSILLLADGSVLHHGTVDQLNGKLRLAGLEAPLHINTVEFALDCIEELQQQQWKLQQHKQTDHVRRERCTLRQLFQNSKAAETDTILTADKVDFLCGHFHLSDGEGFANSWTGETTILTHRYLKNVFRTKELFACRTIQMLISGFVLGSIFHNLGDTLSTAREIVGLFAFILTFLLSSTSEALPIFLQEREIMMKEVTSGNYRLSSYVVANGIAFLPFLLILALLFSVPLYWLVGLSKGVMPFAYFLLLIWLILYTANSVVLCVSSMAPDFIIGNSMVNGVMGSFFLFSGYFIRKDGIPSYWIFMHYISLFKYPFEGFLVNEFSNKCLDYRGGMCLIEGDKLLAKVGLGEDSRWRNVAMIMGLILIYRSLSYLFLKCRCMCARKGGIRRALA